MILIFNPYIGAGPFKFEATPEEIQLNFQDKPKISKDYLGNRRDDFGAIGFCYDENDKLSEICIPPEGVSIYLDTQCLIGDSSVKTLELLLKKDPNPLDVTGFLVFLKLGVNITGFHDNNESQKSFNIFKKGWWDDMLEEATPYKLNGNT